MRSHTWRVGALLFGSGFCALVYQIGWLREFRLIFGASTAASAAVLAIFIGGLGLGGLLLGERADRHGHPLRFYSHLEAIVAISAAASPLLLALVRTGYVAAGGTLRLGLVAGTVARLLFSALVLAVPTVAMGGTLPAAARGATRRDDARRQDVAALYALNTLGAVLGAATATFWWLELLGTRETIWLAAAINLLVAVFARQLDRSAATAAVPDKGPAEAGQDAPAVPAGRYTFSIVAAGVVGFAFFLMELVWYRMLAPLLGGSVFTFGLILAVALAGVGLGGLLYALKPEARRATLSGFAATCLLEALAMGVGFALGDRVAILALMLQPLAHAGFVAQIAGWTLVASLVVLPPALVAGYQFPLLIALFGHGRARVGSEVGLAYAANTLGAMLGSLAGGFGLLPWLSAPGAWRVAALSLVVLGLAAAASGAKSVRSLALQGALAAATIAVFLSTGPTAVWRHSGIGAGRAAISFATPNELVDVIHEKNRTIAWEGDGTESSVALFDANGYAFIVNGKSDGNARGDAGTQVMLGLLGTLLDPGARRALVVGLGTGSTAGWLGAVPTMDRVDVVELEPLVVDVARACGAVNHDALENPKVHVRIADAREVLLTGRDRYDIIASEPSNPFRAGIASLFTREYYTAARQRLSDDGVFVQWMQGYEVDAATLRTVLATLASVFPHVEAWQTTPGDLILAGTNHPLAYHLDDLRARIRQEPFRTAMAQTWRAVDVEGLLAHYVANDRAVRTLAAMPGTPVNTDDRNVIEFGLGRSVGRNGSLARSIGDYARAVGGATPTSIPAASVDWARVATDWVGYQAVEFRFGGFATEVPPDEQAQQNALIAYYRDSDLAAARAAWARQPRGPEGPTELAMVADFFAADGSEAALPLIDRLRPDQPAEADTLLAALRARQSREPEAAAAVEAALIRFRTDPWPLLSFKEKAMGLATTLARRNRVLAPRIYAALSEPFSVHAVQDERRTALALLTPFVDFPRACPAAFGALEPYVPWRAEFLLLRRDCYQAAHDPRLARASADVTAFFAREPAPLVTAPAQ